MHATHFFPYYTWKKGVNLYAGLDFFLHIGVKIGGVDLYMQSTYTRVYTVLMSYPWSHMKPCVCRRPSPIRKLSTCSVTRPRSSIKQFYRAEYIQSELFIVQSGMSHGSIVVPTCTNRGRIKTTSEPVSRIHPGSSSLISIASLQVFSIQVNAASAWSLTHLCIFCDNVVTILT